MTREALSAVLSNVNIFTQDRHSESTTCPRKLDASQDGYLHEMNPCPWHYENNVDYNRIPSTIQHAVCNCAEREGILTTTENRNTDYFCHPVRITMPVLMLRYGDLEEGDCLSLNDYYLDTQEVPVACVPLPHRTSNAHSQRNLYI